MEIDIRDPNTGELDSLPLDIGDNIQEAIQRFGEEAVLARYKQGCAAAARLRVIRLKARKGYLVTNELIKEWMQGWTPGSPEENYEKRNTYARMEPSAEKIAEINEHLAREQDS